MRKRFSCFEALLKLISRKASNRKSISDLSEKRSVEKKELVFEGVALIAAFGTTCLKEIRKERMRCALLPEKCAELPLRKTDHRSQKDEHPDHRIAR